MDKNNNNGSNIVGYIALLTIILIVLKVVPGNDVNKHWDWLWVLSPIWISILIFTVLAVAIGTGYVIYKIVTMKKD